jgi:chromate transporter
LRGRLHVALALGAFVAIEFLGVPFPIVLLVAAILGAATAWHEPRRDSAVAPPPLGYARSHTLRVVIVGLALWLAPLLWLATSGRQTLWSEVYVFFTKAALVTFGGAYAVLGYVTNQLVEHLGWVTAEQSVAGLALAETTPGPLVIVLQFMGFMAGWNQPGGLPQLAAALLGGALAAWATFLPSFVFIFLGAPHVERLTNEPRIGAALAAITAAVVGVIATLALLLAQVVLFPDGWLAWPDWRAVALGFGAWLALERLEWSLPVVLGLAAACGLMLRGLG